MSEGLILDVDGKKIKVIPKEALKPLKRAVEALVAEKIGVMLVCLECKVAINATLECKCSKRRMLE